MCLRKAPVHLGGLCFPCWESEVQRAPLRRFPQEGESVFQGASRRVAGLERCCPIPGVRTWPRRAECPKKTNDGVSSGIQALCAYLCIYNKIKLLNYRPYIVGFLPFQSTGEAFWFSSWWRRSDRTLR